MLGESKSVRSERPDRRAARRDATKAEILDAAWALAREVGLSGISLRDLAGRVGMRAPSLYQYFDSKHAIYDAMFADGYRQALAAREQLDVDTGDFGSALKVWARGFMQFCTADPARYQLLFQRTIPGFEPSPESYALAIEFLERSRRAFADAGLDDAALDLWTALTTGLTSQQISNDPGGDRWARRVDEVVDMFLDHVGGGRSRPS
jgi:AcrR family transcriptional regulator